MRGLKTTIALVLVLGGLLGYIYFVDAKRVIPDPNAKAKAFGEISVDNIEEIEIRSDMGETSKVQRTPDGWQLTAPDKANADQGVVGTVTTNLATLEVQRVVDEKPSDLKQYGLEPARVDVGFRMKDKKDFDHVLVGDKTPTGGDFYAKTPNSPRVFLISNYLDSIFNRSSFDLRDKEILKFDREKADTIEVAKGPTTLQFSKVAAGDWKVVKPIAVRADFAAIEGLMTRLSSTHMQKVVVPEAKNLREYGLDRPQLTASVIAGGARSTLLLGSKTEAGLYAKDSNRPPVFTIEEAVLTDLGKDANEYRRKDIFDGRSFTSNRLELKRGDQTVVLEKSGPADKVVWKNGAGQTVDTMKVEDLINKLSNLRAEMFESGTNAALKMPVLTVTVRFDQTKMESVTFGRMSNVVYASRSDEPGSAKVDTAIFEESLKALDAVK
jgi:hypothetical protein